MHSAITKASPILVRVGTLRDEKIGALVNTANTRRNGQKMGDTQAMICASVNDVVVHGIPTDQKLADGDLVSIDIGVFLNGWVGDAARSFIVGTPRPGDEELIANTWAALEAGIAHAWHGDQQLSVQIWALGHAISLHVRFGPGNLPCLPGAGRPWPR